MHNNILVCRPRWNLKPLLIYLFIYLFIYTKYTSKIQ